MASTAAVIHTRMATPMPIEASPSLAQLRLMQLVSPSLPIGGFTYSQGLEYAVEAGWVCDRESLQDWLLGLIEDSLACLEVPVLARLHLACTRIDAPAVDHWGRYLLSTRETSELRLEEQQRARALLRLIRDLQVENIDWFGSALQHCQCAPFALAAVHWHIDARPAVLGYAWSWLENQVAAAIKLVPLGQTDGQRVLLQLSEALPGAVQRGLELDDGDIGASAPRLAIASSLHETQYTRLFRS